MTDDLIPATPLELVFGSHNHDVCMIFNYNYFYYNNYNRVNALIKYGFNKDVQNPDGSHSPVNPQPSGESLLASPIAYPQQGWSAQHFLL